MFRKNDEHLQMPLMSGLNELPEKLQKQLEGSWAGTFYNEIFVRIDEEIFAPLYSEEASRPNIPVNVLAGLEILKSGNGWSDEEMYENFCFNIQVRYGLGYRNLGVGQFEMRTMYNFRQRLSEHMQKTGEDLFEKVFEQITDEQIEAFAVKTNQQRMDSTQIGSNIREMSRLRLLVEVMQRMHREMEKAEKEEWAEKFEPYLKGSSGQYVYRIKGSEAYQNHLQSIGEVMRQLVEGLAEKYGEKPSYQMLARVFNEHFKLEEEKTQPKEGSELRADSLQSPDDWEAGYRKKGEEEFIGHVANVTETCHPDNDFQLILKMQTESNTTDDAQMLAEVLPELKERTDLEQMYTDGTYGSPDVDKAMGKEGVELIQTAIRGRQPAEDKFNLADCQWEIEPESKQPIAVTAPNGQEVEVETGRKPGRYILRFGHSPEPTTPSIPMPEPETANPVDKTASETIVPDAPIVPSKADPPPVVYFSQQDIDRALRRQRCAELQSEEKNPRAAVEATVGAIKRPFGNDKVPVRGQFRVGMMMIGSAAMVNLRRIWRFQTAQKAQENRKNGQSPLSISTFVQFFKLQISAFLNLYCSIFYFIPLHC